MKKTLAQKARSFQDDRGHFPRLTANIADVLERADRELDDLALAPGARRKVNRVRRFLKTGDVKNL